MPRYPSDNETQITIRVPREWLARADLLAKEANQAAIMGQVTRTDVFRAALRVGLEHMETVGKQPADHQARSRRKTK